MYICLSNVRLYFPFTINEGLTFCKFVSLFVRKQKHVQVKYILQDKVYFMFMCKDKSEQKSLA